MSVLLVLPYVDRPYGGPETVAYYLLSGFKNILKKKKYSHIKITVLSTSPRCKKVQLSDNIHVECLKIPKPVTLLSYVYFEKYLKNLNIVPDIIHAHDIFFAYSSSNHKEYANKAIFTLHGLVWKERKYSTSIKFKLSSYIAEYELRKILKNAKIVAISKYVKKALISHYKMQPQRINVIYNPVPDCYFSIQKRELEPYPIIFYPASIIPLKNQFLLLRVSKLLKMEVPEFKMIFAGRIGDRNYYYLMKKYVQKNGLGGNIVFMGEVPKPKILELWSLATIGIIPSLEETFSLSLVEGLASGTPMLTSPVGVAPEVIVPGKTGFFIDPHNPYDVAEKLIAILEDKALRRKIGKSGQKISRVFHSENIALKTLDLWRYVYEGL